MDSKKINFDNIKSRVKLSDFAKKLGMQLTKENRACCHLHHEKTPSLNFNDEKGFYYCFGCHKSGDIFSLVQEVKHLSFLESVRFVAEAVGVPLEDNYSIIRESDEFKQKKELLYEIMDDISRFFEKKLHSNKIILEYLVSRGLNIVTIEKFRLGYSQFSEESELIEKLSNKYSNNIHLLLDSGLFRRSSNHSGNRFYNMLHDRIIFPICDKFGKVIAFGGRTLSDDNKIAKYINCGDSLIFKKSENLYGENFVRRKAKEENEILIVEGYLDCLQMHQAGFENTVAPLGTAISIFQIDYCWSIVDKVTCALDGDIAGRKAMISTINKALPILKPGKFLSFSHLPSGLDPSDMITGGRIIALRALLKEPKTISHMLWEASLKKYTMKSSKNDPDLIAGIKKDLINNLKLITDDMVRGEYARYFKTKVENLIQYSNKDKRSEIVSNRVHDTDIRNDDRNYENFKYKNKYIKNESAINLYDKIFCCLLALIFIFPEKRNEFAKEELINMIYLRSNNRHELKEMLEYSMENCFNKNTDDFKKKFSKFGGTFCSKYDEIFRSQDMPENLWLKHFFYILRLIELKEQKAVLRSRPLEMMRLEVEENRINDFIINGSDYEYK